MSVAAAVGALARRVAAEFTARFPSRTTDPAAVVTPSSGYDFRTATATITGSIVTISAYVAGPIAANGYTVLGVITEPYRPGLRVVGTAELNGEGLGIVYVFNTGQLRIWNPTNTAKTAAYITMTYPLA